MKRDPKSPDNSVVDDASVDSAVDSTVDSTDVGTALSATSLSAHALSARTQMPTSALKNVRVERFITIRVAAEESR